MRSSIMQLDSLPLRQLILSRLREHEDRVLISDESEVWTGREILKKIERLKALIETHTPPRAPVLVSFPNSSVNAIAILAVIVSDRVPVLLAPQDLAQDPSSWLKRVKPALALVDREYALFRSSLETPPMYILNHSSNIQATVNPNLKLEDARVHEVAEATALVLYTSGSTGAPKGICIPARGIIETSHHLIKRFGLNEDSISPVVLPICHSMGLNTQFFPTLLAGGRAHFVDIHLELSKLYRTIVHTEGTFVSLIGEILMYCHKEKEKRNLQPSTRVQHVQLAGGMISSLHLEAARELFPNAKIHKGYGLTEAIRVTMIDSDDPDFLTDSVGYPLDFTEVEIRDDDQIVTAPFQIGEIWVAGPNTLSGILGMPVPTKRLDPFSTGDLGYWNHRKQLCIVGRDDGLFKFNGNRVPGSEIEKVALGTSRSIRNSKCLLVEDPKTGRSRITLFVEVVDLEESQSLEEKLTERMRNFSHPPKKVVFMTKFPSTSNGKVSLSKLRNYRTVKL